MELETDLTTLKKMRASWQKALMHAPCAELADNIKAQIASMDAAIKSAEQAETVN